MSCLSYYKSNYYNKLVQNNDLFNVQYEIRIMIE